MRWKTAKFISRFDCLSLGERGVMRSVAEALVVALSGLINGEVLLGLVYIYRR